MNELPPYARHLKAALDLRGWTMAELADAMPPSYRLSRSTLEKIGRGIRAPLEYEYPVLAELLGVPEWFLRDGVHASTAAPAAGGDELGEKVTWLVSAVDWCVLTLLNVSQAVEAAGVDEAAAPPPQTWVERAGSRGG